MGDGPVISESQSFTEDSSLKDLLSGWEPVGSAAGLGFGFLLP